MEKSVFVSDVHLNSPEDQRWTQFLKFLKQVKSDTEVSDLFLLGDIFDLWIGNHQFFKSKFKVFIDELKSIAERGVKIHYFEGNHDLYLRTYFEQELGFKVYEGPHVFNLYGRSVRVEHGDQIDPDDKGYIFLRWFLRTGFMKWFARSMPESLIVKIGSKSSETSREYTSQVKTIQTHQAIEKIRTHAKSKACQEELDMIISGHLHVRDEFTFQCGKKEVKSINLGSWYDSSLYYPIDSIQGGEFSSLG